MATGQGRHGGGTRPTASGSVVTGLASNRIRNGSNTLVGGPTLIRKGGRAFFIIHYYFLSLFLPAPVLSVTCS